MASSSKTNKSFYVVIVMVLCIGAYVYNTLTNYKNEIDELKEEQIKSTNVSVTSTSQTAGEQEAQERLQNEIAKLYAAIEKRDAALDKLLKEQYEDDDQRAKLLKSAQEDIAQLAKSLQRIQASAHKESTWSQFYQQYKQGIFLCIAHNPQTGSVGIGTAFVIDKKGLLATNAHIVQLLRAMPQRFMIQNESGKIYKIKRAAHNPLFVTLSSPDIGVIELDMEGMGDGLQPLPLASDLELADITVGTNIGTFGYPGELQKQYLAGKEAEHYKGAVATFKQGWIGRVTNYKGQIDAAGKNTLIQHSASLSGGTSGSPIINAKGKVIAVSSSSMTSSFKVGSIRTRELLSAAQIGFAIRIDELRTFLTEAKFQTLP